MRERFEGMKDENISKERNWIRREKEKKEEEEEEEEEWRKRIVPLFDEKD